MTNHFEWGAGQGCARRSVYLDYAAATPMDPEVVAAMLPYFSEKFENPSAPYAAARAVRADVSQAVYETDMLDVLQDEAAHCGRAKWSTIFGTR